jgi:hypothetical protein
LAVVRHLETPSSIEIDGVDKEELGNGSFLQNVVQKAVTAFSDEFRDIEPSVIRISLKSNTRHINVVVLFSFLYKRSPGSSFLAVVKHPEIRPSYLLILLFDQKHSYLSF